MSKELQIRRPIVAFIEAINDHNTEEFLATLTDSAVITDEGQDCRGIAAIKEWSDEKCIGAKVTLKVINGEQWRALVHHRDAVTLLNQRIGQQA